MSVLKTFARLRAGTLCTLLSR